MTVPVFVDTNVFIYAVDQADPRKQNAARLWREMLWRSRRGRVSFQVLHEFFAKVTKKWPDAREAACAEVRDLLLWQPTVLDAPILELTWKMQQRYQLSFWDSLIVSAAKVAGCKYLLSEDFQAGQNLAGVVVVNPFLKAPEFLVGL